MHPDIEKLITLALSDGTVTEKEREIILRKAEKLNLDIDEVEMYLEGKIANHSGINPKDSSANQVSKSSKREFVPKVVQRVQPAKLDREATLAENIKNLELLYLINQIYIKKLEEERLIIKKDILRLKEIIKRHKETIKPIQKELIKERDRKISEYADKIIEKVDPVLKSKLKTSLNKSNKDLPNVIFYKKWVILYLDYKKIYEMNLNYEDGEFFISKKREIFNKYELIFITISLILIIISTAILGLGGFIGSIVISLFSYMVFFGYIVAPIVEKLGNQKDQIMIIFEDASLDLRPEYEEIKNLIDKINANNRLIEEMPKIPEI